MAKTLKREIITTKDGSQTLFIPELNENYHSINGALQESLHVFINAGLALYKHQKQVSIFEVGFGTGLNALVTLWYQNKLNNATLYHSIEKYPLTKNEYELLSYPTQIEGNEDYTSAFESMHTCNWDETFKINGQFKLTKMHTDLEAFKTTQKYNLIYFDAFAPDIQPNLWTEEVFKKMCDILEFEGVLVTYSAKGQVRRNLQSAGFRVERIPGPPGKREMLRATKINE